MDRRVSKSLLGLENLLHYDTFTKSIRAGELYLYLAVTPYAVSSALIREEGRVQKPVYYTSRALRGVEGQYPLIEKLCIDNSL